MLQLLYQDISLLVQDAEEIRSKLLCLKGQLPMEVEAAIYPTVYIESHQVRVLEAKQRISDSASQVELITKRDASQSQTMEVRARIEVLENSRPIIMVEIDRLKAQRSQLNYEGASRSYHFPAGGGEQAGEAAMQY